MNTNQTGVPYHRTLLYARGMVGFYAGTAVQDIYHQINHECS